MASQIERIVEAVDPVVRIKRREGRRAVVEVAQVAEVLQTAEVAQAAEVLQAVEADEILRELALDAVCRR